MRVPRRRAVAPQEQRCPRAVRLRRSELAAQLGPRFVTAIEALTLFQLCATGTLKVPYRVAAISGGVEFREVAQLGVVREHLDRRGNVQPQGPLQNADLRVL